MKNKLFLSLFSIVILLTFSGCSGAAEGVLADEESGDYTGHKFR
ncbi:hypothetical protein [Halalkalibacter akibai]|nr:hypothetical protein [Halalkalibacter akibai]